MIGNSRKLASFFFFTILAECVNASEATLFVWHILALNIIFLYAFQNVCSIIVNMKHLHSEFMKK